MRSIDISNLSEEEKTELKNSMKPVTLENAKPAYSLKDLQNPKNLYDAILTSKLYDHANYVTGGLFLAVKMRKKHARVLVTDRFGKIWKLVEYHAVVDSQLVEFAESYLDPVDSKERFETRDELSEMVQKSFKIKEGALKIVTESRVVKMSTKLDSYYNFNIIMSQVAENTKEKTGFKYTLLTSMKGPNSSTIMSEINRFNKLNEIKQFIEKLPERIKEKTEEVSPKYE